MIQPYGWQVPEVEHFVKIFRDAEEQGGFTAALCASDTGVGKTVIALEVMKSLGRSPLIICPKAVIPAWESTAEEMEVPVRGVVNIEKLKAGGWPSRKDPVLIKHSKQNFEWVLPEHTQLIVDEVQGFSSWKSQNAYALALTKAFKLNVLMLSATAADSPVKMRAIGYLLGLHKFRDFYTWALKNGCYRNAWNGLDFSRGPKGRAAVEAIHKQVFPARGHRISIADVPDFPETAIFAESYDLGKYKKEVQQIYDEMDYELRHIGPDQNALTILLRARQSSELLKVPLLLDMTREFLDEGKSVVLFVNFKETRSRLVEELEQFLNGKVSQIAGGQKPEERQNWIDAFQQDRTRVCVCAIQAGGVGVSLDDRRGEYPRVSLVTPNYSAVELKQALGRIHRASSKSKSLQYILFASGTVEEDACNAVKRKLRNIDLLNDGDLTGGIL